MKFKCFCGKKGFAKELCEMHYKQKYLHYRTYFECPRCNKIFRTIYNINNLVCPFCNYGCKIGLHNRLQPVKIELFKKIFLTYREFLIKELKA
jgi:transcription elongation factor Elf1